MSSAPLVSCGAGEEAGGHIAVAAALCLCAWGWGDRMRSQGLPRVLQPTPWLHSAC